MSLFRSVASSVVSKAARDKTAGRGLISMGLGIIAARLATRSVPGALAVGSALVAKHFWDKKRLEDDSINTPQELVEENPGIAMDIAREKPEMMTDEYDDLDLKAEIEERKNNPADDVPPYPSHS